MSTTKELIENYKNNRDSYYYEMRAAVQDCVDVLHRIVKEISGEEISVFDYQLSIGENSFEIKWLPFAATQVVEFEEICDFDEEKYRREIRDLILTFKKSILNETQRDIIQLETEIERLESLI